MLLFRKKHPDVEKCQKGLKIKFKDPDLLLEALTHDSYTPDSKERDICNERLEFLGDSVLGLIIGAELYLRFPDLSEGELTQMKSNLVNAVFLAKKARQIELGKYIRVGNLDGPQIRNNTSVLSDCFEGLLGALFLDRGLERVRKFLLKIYHNDLEGMEVGAKDAKSLLQEIVQKKHKLLPQYKVVKEEGPAHKKHFIIEVWLLNEKLGSGEGASKRKAQQKAAEIALANLLARSAKTKHADKSKS